MYVYLIAILVIACIVISEVERRYNIKRKNYSNKIDIKQLKNMDSRRQLERKTASEKN